MMFRFPLIHRSAASGLFCVALLLSAVEPLRAKDDSSTSGSFWRKVEDSGIGSFVMPAGRNRSDRERIMNVLAYQGVISYDSKGGVIVKRQDKLDAYYKSLQSSGTLKKAYGFSNEEGQDPHGEKSGQFWHNFFNKKEVNSKDLPESMDPFANDSRGLATAMHRQLIYATDDASTDYAKTAGDLHVRGIDILDKDMRKGVAAGAEVYIKALDAMTAGQSTKAVEWANEAAEYADKVGSDPGKAAKEYLESKIREELQNKLTETLKNTMGEDNYEKMMEKYEKYGSEKDRVKKMMEDLAKITGDPRLVEASKQLDNLSPEALAAKAYEKMMEKKKEEEKKKAKEKEKKPVPEKKADDAKEKADKAKAEKKATAPTSPQQAEAEADNSNKVTKGYVKGKDGSQITIIEERDEKGRLIRETHTQTDAKGNIISQTDYEGGKGEGKERVPQKKADLKGQEGDGSGDVGDMADQPSVVDDWVQDVEKKGHDAHVAGIKGMEGQLELSEADAAGEADRAEARATREYGAGKAKETRDESAADTADAEREQSFGKIIADAVEKAVEEGITATGGAFGSEVGRRVADDLFEDKKTKVEEDDGAVQGTAVASAPVASGTSSGSTAASTPAKPATAATTPKAPDTSKPTPATGEKSSPASIYCPKCHGTSFGPYELVPWDPRGITRDRKCLTCGHWGGVIGTPPPEDDAATASPTNAPPEEPAVSKPDESKEDGDGYCCPRCGGRNLIFAGTVYICTDCDWNGVGSNLGCQ